MLLSGTLEVEIPLSPYRSRVHLPWLPPSMAQWAWWQVLIASAVLHTPVLLFRRRKGFLI